MIILLLPHFQQIHTLNPTLTVPNALRARRSQPITIQREQYKRLTRPGGDVFQSVQQIKNFFFFFLAMVGWVGGLDPSRFQRLAVQHCRFHWMLLALLLSLVSRSRYDGARSNYSKQRSISTTLIEAERKNILKSTRGTSCSLWRHISAPH